MSTVSQGVKIPTSGPYAFGWPTLHDTGSWWMHPMHPMRYGFAFGVLMETEIQTLAFMAEPDSASSRISASAMWPFCPCFNISFLCRYRVSTLTAFLSGMAYNKRRSVQPYFRLDGNLDRAGLCWTSQFSLEHLKLAYFSALTTSCAMSTGRYSRR